MAAAVVLDSRPRNAPSPVARFVLTAGRSQTGAVQNPKINWRKSMMLLKWVARMGGSYRRHSTIVTRPQTNAPDPARLLAE